MAKKRALDDSNCNPVSPASITALLPRLRGDILTTTLLRYELGLRIGEATGLRWEDVTFGTEDSDVRRSVLIRRSRVGNQVGPTKSGRERRVAMSRRTRAHLMERFIFAGRPARGWVVEQSWHKNCHERLRKGCKAAKIDAIRFKDLRDTYASTLITHGIVPKWISLQLGHASVGTTERHYARYMAVEGYQNPWVVPEGMVPSDLFATLDGWSHQIRTRRHQGFQLSGITGRNRVIPRSGTSPPDRAADPRPHRSATGLRAPRCTDPCGSPRSKR